MYSYIWSLVLWPPHAKSWLIGKDFDAGRDWGQNEKGTTENEMAGWHHWLDGRWVWVNSGSWWWTGRPGLLRFMGSQRVGHDWATELNWILRCVYVPQVSYPLVCWWASRLLPCPGYYKQCCYEHWGTHLFHFWFLRYVCPAVGLLGHMAVLFLVF